VQDLPRRKTGRQRLPLADVIFAAAFKTYSTFSGRRFMTDLREAHAKGYLSKLPCYNSVFNYLDMTELTPILKALIEETSRPLRGVETCFAGDSTGFSTYKFVRWFDAKYGKEMSRHVWVKCHLMCGVKTNVVTSVIISDSHDSPLLPDMLKATTANFDVKEVSLDKGYLSVNNLEVITQAGAAPYIPFKRNSTEDKGGLWAKLFHYFCFRQEEFLQHNHRRSNVESTYSMIKRKFGDHIRSKTSTAMVNEVLCKVLCHNVCVLVQEMYELGIEPTFWGEKPSEEQKLLQAKKTPAIDWRVVGSKRFGSGARSARLKLPAPEVN
jgi:transposase